MATVFITGSSEGFGLMTGRLLEEKGHAVVLHARNGRRRARRAGDRRLLLP
jgi:NADP-dependent 3-hydroxy acid dehydrogenase YdfG